MIRLAIGPRTARYAAVREYADRLRAAGLATEFDAVSIGYAGGQAALVPLDESSREMAERIVHCVNNYPVLDARIQKLEAALREWKCPACGGRTTYVNRGPGARASREPGYRHPAEETLPCRKCAGTGLHPTAAAALVP